MRCTFISKNIVKNNSPKPNDYQNVHYSVCFFKIIFIIVKFIPCKSSSMNYVSETLQEKLLFKKLLALREDSDIERTKAN